jgi:hypothetical protein
MSYAYDTMGSVFRYHIRPLLAAAGKERLADHFEDLIEEMHSANHDVPSADGIFKGDGINKHHGVSRAARELDEHVKEIEKKEKGGGR